MIVIITIRVSKVKKKKVLGKEEWNRMKPENIVLLFLDLSLWFSEEKPSLFESQREIREGERSIFRRVMNW